MAAKRIYSSLLLKYVENMDNWLREIDIWECITELHLKEKGIAVYLTLPYKICQAGEDISLASSNKKNGSRILLEKLKELHAKDRHFLAKMTCNKFESFHDQKT